jgi:flavin reductase (DIM6/NTAB) family NADH-FMN oxidoreductase RutF
MWGQVEILAPLTAKNPAPEIKAKSKYCYEREKFEAAKLTPLPSELVKPARVQECPVQMEARVRAAHQLGGKKLEEIGGGIAVEVEILRVHVVSDPIFDERYINPAKWSPLIYTFRHYYRLAPEELGKSFRAEI